MVKRTTRWARTVWASAKVPSWMDEIDALWWGWAGHVARTAVREPTRLMATVIPWKGVWWRKTMIGVHHNETYLGRVGLQRGHRRQGKRRWDESHQSHIDEITGGNMPWEDAAQERDGWKGHEVQFVARITRKLATNVQLIGAPATEAELT